jgi:glycosyltransferase involved in cell wall biosynthesis
MSTGSNPLVSVVVPTYDRPDALPGAVRSALDQAYEPIEVVVVDDASPTPARRTLERASLDDPAITLVQHDRNQGGSAARNTGIRRAEGRYIAFLDDDDRWEPTKIGSQVRQFERGGDDVGLVYTGERVVDDRGRTEIVRDASLQGTVTKELLCRNDIGSFSVAMVRSDVIGRAGYLDERFPSWQDQEWYVRVSRHCSIEPIDRPLTIRRRDASDRITTDIGTTRDETIPLFLSKYRPLARQFGPLFPRKMHAWAAFRLGELAASQEQYEVARSLLTRAVSAYPFEPSFFKHFLPLLGGHHTYEPALAAKRLLDGQR